MEKTTTHIEVSLVGPSSGFFRSLLAKDGARKQIRMTEISGSGQIVTSKTFTGWSGLPSPLPPFGSRVLKSRLVIGPAAVVCSPEGSLFAIAGANYVGKTSLALSLVDIGWQLVSDHLLIIEQASGSVLSYLSPIGLRRRTLQRYSSQLRYLDTRLTISEDTGPVVLVRPEELMPGKVATGGRLAVLLQLTRSETARAPSLLPGGSVPPLFPTSAASSVMELFNPVVRARVVVPARMGSPEIADWLSQQEIG